MSLYSPAYFCTLDLNYFGGKDKRQKLKRNDGEIAKISAWGERRAQAQLGAFAPRGPDFECIETAP